MQHRGHIGCNLGQVLGSLARDAVYLLYLCTDVLLFCGGIGILHDAERWVVCLVFANSNKAKRVDYIYIVVYNAFAKWGTCPAFPNQLSALERCSRHTLLVAIFTAW